MGVTSLNNNYVIAKDNERVRLTADHYAQGNVTKLPENNE